MKPSGVDNPPSSDQIRLAIFASGGGSNADKICQYFNDHDRIMVALIVSNKPNAGVRQVADQHEVPFSHLSNEAIAEGQPVLELCQKHHITAIILAGFLRKIPAQLIQHYPNRILNIHPALLPKFGGKGMYGQHVHQAVYQAKEATSGPTIHLVNEEYDDGAILFQAETPIHNEDLPEDIAKKVLQLEHRYFAPVIEEYLQSQPVQP